ncbi:hypothetical protein B0H21DRAFT_824450 [Amylocystis lapponica]|nr:hypothetical protein B0H21DRAFT_824450 [Amylocystis lapponica]
MSAVLSPSPSSPSPTTTKPSTMQSTTAKAFKGKYTRSWQQLPPEIVKLIATFYLTDVCSQTYFPTTWDVRELWPSRMVYGVMRDALEMEKIMCLCPAWSMAPCRAKAYSCSGHTLTYDSVVETHKWWKHALAVIDPLESIAPPTVLPPPPAEQLLQKSSS